MKVSVVIMDNIRLFFTGGIDSRLFLERITQLRAV
jgi:hypothetical protein